MMMRRHKSLVMNQEMNDNEGCEMNEAVDSIDEVMQNEKNDWWFSKMSRLLVVKE